MILFKDLPIGTRFRLGGGYGKNLTKVPEFIDQYERICNCAEEQPGRTPDEPPDYLGFFPYEDGVCIPIAEII